MAVTRQTSRKTLILQPTNAEVSTNQVYAPRYEFLVDGELTLPVPRIINSLKHTDAAASIYRVDVSVNKGGTSQYNIQIISYNQLGVDPIIHVDQTITLDTDRLRTTIPVTDAAVGENRSLECVVTEVNANVPATDMTVTIIMEDFADLQVERRGHRILDGDGIVQPQKDDLQFTGANVSEDVLNQRTVVDVGFIGQMINSMLTEAQMQTLYGTGWILSDGRSVAGSLYEAVTGAGNVPDARGAGLRGKNNGRNDGNQDPDGERSLGSYQADTFGSHTHIQNAHTHIQNDHNHSVAATSGNTGGTVIAGILSEVNRVSRGLTVARDLVTDASTVLSTQATNQNTTATNNNTGGNETRMKNIATNIFIKIN